MAISYQIILRDSFGNINRVVDYFTALEYMRVVNKVGSLKLTVPDFWDARRNTSAFDVFSAVDSQIEVWRQVDGRTPRLECETVWFIRSPARVFNQNNQRMIEASAVDAIELLTRRVVLYSGYYFRSQRMDDAAKQIVTDQFKTASVRDAVTRRLGSIFTVEANTSQAWASSVDSPVGASGVVMDAVSGLANASTNAATGPIYMAFDVVYVEANHLEFRTYTGQRGLNHLSTGAIPIVLDPDAGNLANSNLTLDYTQEYNFVQMVRARPEIANLTAVAYDAARIGLSAYNLREKQIGGGPDNSALLQAQAQTNVRQGRPRRIFQGQIIPTPGMQYGVHFGFGDTVAVNVANTKLNARLDGIRVMVDTGPEVIEAIARADELLDNL